jgi:hypothetical protein
MMIIREDTDPNENGVASGFAKSLQQRFRPIRRHAIIYALHAGFVHHAKSQKDPTWLSNEARFFYRNL